MKLTTDCEVTAFVQGAGQGLGLAFTKVLLSHGIADRVYASFRSPIPSLELVNLANQYPERLHLISLDVTIEDSISGAVQQIERRSSQIHIMINCAGVLHGLGLKGPEKRLNDLDNQTLLAYFKTNTIGPALMLKHFTSLFPSKGRVLIGNISARVGSIGENHLGGWYGYRASKAAQNMITKTASIELSRKNADLICVGLHPGTVKTQLSAPFRKRIEPGHILSPEESATKLINLLLSLSPKDTGLFFSHDGQILSW